MILLFNSKEERDTRNIVEAVKRGCDMITTKFWWSNVDENEYPNVWGLYVKDGEGLTDAEIAQCVDELPIETNE
jgi:hypothetical protein